MPQNELNFLIADDEAPARRKVLQLLQTYGKAFHYEEATDGLQALQLLKNGQFDLALLDIQMPKYTGMEVVRQIGFQYMPPVIFLTAYNEFAIQAFEVHAVDYLLKPFDFDRFKRALDRVFEHTASPKSQNLEKLSPHFPSKNYREHLWVNKSGSYLPLPVNEVPVFGVDGNYAECEYQGRTYLLRESLQHLEEQLDPAVFRRTHRSWLVNMHFIKAVHSKSHGDCTIELKDGRSIPMSRRYRKNLIG
ncbi:MAG: LytTR family DNA-binding domain-containing protein [Saprospiraceae bacterium]|nr:LytTR family DNA-binding domain-containing protein [Saprospiraceae bacterium]